MSFGPTPSRRDTTFPLLHGSLIFTLNHPRTEKGKTINGREFQQSANELTGSDELKSSFKVQRPGAGGGAPGAISVLIRSAESNWSGSSIFAKKLLLGITVPVNRIGVQRCRRRFAST